MAFRVGPNYAAWQSIHGVSLEQTWKSRGSAAGYGRHRKSGLEHPRSVGRVSPETHVKMNLGFCVLRDRVADEMIRVAESGLRYAAVRNGILFLPSLPLSLLGFLSCVTVE